MVLYRFRLQFQFKVCISLTQTIFKVIDELKIIQMDLHLQRDSILMYFTSIPVTMSKHRVCVS